MIDINQIIVSGTASWHSLKKAPVGNFGALSLRVALPKFEYIDDGVLNQIQSPMIWLDVPVSYVGDKLTSKDQEMYNSLTVSKMTSILITGGKITNWIKKGSNGALDETMFKLECSSSNVNLSISNFDMINDCTISGKVISHSKNKLLVQTSYKNPKTNEWKNRLIPVIYTNSLHTNLVNKNILLKGQVCNVTPTGESKLYIATDFIIPL